MLIRFFHKDLLFLDILISPGNSNLELHVYKVIMQGKLFQRYVSFVLECTVSGR